MDVGDALGRVLVVVCGVGRGDELILLAVGNEVVRSVIVVNSIVGMELNASLRF